MIELHVTDPGLRGLPLLVATGDAWLHACAAAPERLLDDHAHCELKAASTAMRLVGRYAERTRLVLELTALAREELRHFERVHALVLARGRALSKPGPDDYVKALRNRAQRGIAGDATLLDQLVICAFVEARSCERFRKLATGPSRSEGPESTGPFDRELVAFWAELGEAESRHHELFLDLAREAVGEGDVRRRVAEVAAIEARIIEELPVAPRMH